jgi:hypothetical protein
MQAHPRNDRGMQYFLRCTECISLLRNGNLGFSSVTGAKCGCDDFVRLAPDRAAKEPG